MRGLLAVFVVLTTAGCLSLLVLSDRTAELFAWTIRPPLSAAFLGAGYGAGLLLSALSLRVRDWTTTRVPFVTVLVFTWMTTAATALHADRLHMSSPGIGPFATPAAWVWVVVYAVIPPAMTVALFLQVRGSASALGPPVSADMVPLPRHLAVLLAVQGVAMAAAGLALLAAPTRTGWWAWELTPFTARVVAAWLLAFGTAAALALRSGDLRSLRVSTTAYTAFGGLQLLALYRHAEDLTGPRPTVVAWLLLVVAVLLTGSAGWWRAASIGPGRHLPAGPRRRG